MTSACKIKYLKLRNFFFQYTFQYIKKNMLKNTVLFVRNFKISIVLLNNGKKNQDKYVLKKIKHGFKNI